MFTILLDKQGEEDVIFSAYSSTLKKKKKKYGTGYRKSYLYTVNVSMKGKLSKNFLSCMYCNLFL
jgi:pyocin large subunit-like protein